jgi:hypothetical protein
MSESRSSGPRPAGPRETDPAEATMSVLRGIWAARGRSGAEWEQRLGHGGAKACKNMADIGFGGMGVAPSDAAGDTNTPVDPDLRAAWRRRLEREGKLRPDAESIGERVRRDLRS